MSLSLQAMCLKHDKPPVPEPEHLCRAPLHPGKPSQALIEGRPRASPACPLQPYGLIMQDAGAPACRSGRVLGSGVTLQSCPGCFCWGQAPSLPCKPSRAHLPSPCSRMGAVDMFFCSALPCPIRDGAAYLRNCLTKQTAAQKSLQEACLGGTEPCLLCLVTPSLGAGTWGSVRKEV